MTEENFSFKVLWTGNQDGGTVNRESFNRSLLLVLDNKPVIYGTSSLKKYRKPLEFTAEELFASSISMAYMLHFLELSAMDGITITQYIGHTNIRIKFDLSGCVNIAQILLQPEIVTDVSSYIATAENLALSAKNSCGLLNHTKIDIAICPKISAAN